MCVCVCVCVLTMWSDCVHALERVILAKELKIEEGLILSVRGIGLVQIYCQSCVDFDLALYN